MYASPMSPKVKHYSAAWLHHYPPGASLFQPSLSDASSSRRSLPSSSPLSPGPRRTIAHRGTEVFVAVGKEIRWGDLVYLQERYNEAPPRAKQEGRDTPGASAGDGAASYVGSEDVPADGVRVSG